MAITFHDRVRQTSSSTGTGNLTLDGSVPGYRDFSVAGSDQFYYTIELAPDYEVGLGSVDAGELVREQVLVSSNANSTVNWGAGTKNIFITLPASQVVPKQDPSLSGTISLGNNALIRGAMDSAATAPAFRSSTGSVTRLVAQSPVATASGFTSFQAIGSSDWQNSSWLQLRSTGDHTSTTSARILWGKTIAGADSDADTDFQFLTRQGGAYGVRASINRTGTPANNTDLTTKLYVDTAVDNVINSNLFVRTDRFIDDGDPFENPTPIEWLYTTIAPNLGPAEETGERSYQNNFSLYAANWGASTNNVFTTFNHRSNNGIFDCGFVVQGLNWNSTNNQYDVGLPTAALRFILDSSNDFQRGEFSMWPQGNTNIRNGGEILIGTNYGTDAMGQTVFDSVLPPTMSWGFDHISITNDNNLTTKKYVDDKVSANAPYLNLHENDRLWMRTAELGFDLTGFGSASAGPFSSSSYLGRIDRQVLTSAAAASSFARYIKSNFIDSSANFTFGMVFGLAASGGNSDNRQVFIAIGTTIGSFSVGTTNEPDAALNFIGIGKKVGDTQLSIMHNDGSGTATIVGLSSTDFPYFDGTTAFKFEITRISGEFTWTLTNLETSASATGTVSGDCPTGDISCNFQVGQGSNSTGSSSIVLSKAWIKFL